MLLRVLQCSATGERQCSTRVAVRRTVQRPAVSLRVSFPIFAAAGTQGGATQAGAADKSRYLLRLCPACGGRCMPGDQLGGLNFKAGTKADGARPIVERSEPLMGGRERGARRHRISRWDC
eukprot:5079758-Pyramimonas_sp.AAC.1